MLNHPVFKIGDKHYRAESDSGAVVYDPTEQRYTHLGHIVGVTTLEAVSDLPDGYQEFTCG